MPRYIDATKLLKEFQALPCCRNGYSDEYDKARIFAMIDNQPTADVVERQKGKWVVVTRHEHYPSGKPYEQLQCPFCKRLDRNGDGSFCGYCGADMRGEEDNADND